jgi:hypothetical protein
VSKFILCPPGTLSLFYIFSCISGTRMFDIMYPTQAVRLMIPIVFGKGS